MPGRAGLLLASTEGSIGHEPWARAPAACPAWRSQATWCRPLGSRPRKGKSVTGACGRAGVVIKGGRDCAGRRGWGAACPAGASPHWDTGRGLGCSPHTEPPPVTPTSRELSWGFPPWSGALPGGWGLVPLAPAGAQSTHTRAPLSATVGCPPTRRQSQEPRQTYLCHSWHPARGPRSRPPEQTPVL